MPSDFTNVIQGTVQHEHDAYVTADGAPKVISLDPGIPWTLNYLMAGSGIGEHRLKGQAEDITSWLAGNLPYHSGYPNTPETMP